MATATEELKKETLPEEEVPLTDYQLAVQVAQFQRSNGYIDEATYETYVKDAESKATDEEKAQLEKERVEAEAKAKKEAEEKVVADEEETEETDAEKGAKAKEVKEASEAKAKSDAEAAAKKEADKKAADELKKSKRVEREAVDDDTVQRAADLAAQKVLEQSKPKIEPAPDTFESTLPKAYKKDLAVARFIAQSDPKQANLPNQFLQAYKTEGEYIAKWEAEHSGDEFDADAEEHKQFYTRTFPKIDEEEFEASKEAMLEAQITQRVEAKVQERIKPKVERVETVEKLRETGRAIESKAHEAVVELLTAEGEDGKPLFPTVHEHIVVDGKKVLTDEIGKKVEELDPVAFTILDEQASRVRFLTTEVRRLAVVGDGYRKMAEERAVSGESKEVREQAKLTVMAHKELNNFALDLEDRMEGQKDDDGRKFIRQDELQERVTTIVRATMKPEQKEAAIRDLDKRFFTLTADIIERELIKDSAKKSFAEIARINALVEKRSGSTRGKPTNSEPPEKPAEEGETPPEPRKPKPPTTVSASDKTNTGKKGGVQGAITPEQFANSAFS